MANPADGCGPDVTGSPGKQGGRAREADKGEHCGKDAEVMHGHKVPRLSAEENRVFQEQDDKIANMPADFQLPFVFFSVLY
jgi:hypothetical protein